MPNRNINSVNMHYEEKGIGQPLVFLHGFPLDSRMWEAQIAELSARCRVIAPDFRGFGQSQPGAAFTMESLAKDVHALVVELGAEQCVLAGLSMGGYVALNYARLFPESLRGLVLLDTRAEADTPAGMEGRQKMIELVRRKGSKAVADQMEPKLLSPDTIAHRPATVGALRRMMESCTPQTIEFASVAMRDRRDSLADLPAIKTPTLILVGDADAITPVAMAQTMNKYIAGSRLVVVSGAGHMSPMEQPTQVNRAIRNFVGEMASF